MRRRSIIYFNVRNPLRGVVSLTESSHYLSKYGNVEGTPRNRRQRTDGTNLEVEEKSCDVDIEINKFVFLVEVWIGNRLMIIDWANISKDFNIINICRCMYIPA